MEKFSIVFTREYNGVEYEVVVEDDVITTGKAYVNDECVIALDDLTLEDGSDIPYTYGNLNKTFAFLRGAVSPSNA
jgi:hypothetical protein